MRVIDLGWPIQNGMIVFPGDREPSVELKTTVEADGFRSSMLHTSTHTGTHMDAPAHMVADGKFMDELPNETFFGFAQVVDARACAGRKIEVADIKKSVDDVRNVDFLLFDTGWNEKWGKEEYLYDFPILSEDAAKWIAAQQLKGIGFDTISIDPVDSMDNPIHKIIFAKNMVVIENLHNLEKVGEKPFCFVALPISLKHQDGGPTRAMAVLD